MRGVSTIQVADVACPGEDCYVRVCKPHHSKRGSPGAGDGLKFTGAGLGPGGRRGGAAVGAAQGLGLVLRCGREGRSTLDVAAATAIQLLLLLLLLGRGRFPLQSLKLPGLQLVLPEFGRGHGCSHSLAGGQLVLITGGHREAG